MKKVILSKDKSKRNSFILGEQNSVSTRALYLDKRFLNLASELSWFAPYRFLNFFKKVSVTRIKNRCIITNRSGFVFSRFGLSRIAFRDLVSNSYFYGIKKSSW